MNNTDAARGVSIWSAPRPALSAAAMGFGIALCWVVAQTPVLGLQVVPMLLLTAIALALACFDSRFLTLYIVSVWCIEPEIRRLVDWETGAYHSVTVLSLTPLSCSASLVVPIARRWRKISNSIRRVCSIMAGCIAYALVVGIAKNGAAALYEMTNLVAPMLFIPYFASQELDVHARERMLSSMVAVGVIVALYGWIQFVVAPPWDMFWIKQSGMTSSMGIPEPLKFRLFSTLNSTGTTAVFLGYTLALAVVNSRLRTHLGWVSVLLIASALAVTEVRAAWITVVVILVSYTSFSTGRSRWQAMAGVVLLAAGTVFLVPRLPGGDTFVARVQTFSDLKHDNSANDRQALIGRVLPNILQNPVGNGFGSTGVGDKLAGGIGNGSYDNGFLALLQTFGFIGFACFAYSVWLLMVTVFRLRKRADMASLMLISVAISIATLQSLTAINVLDGGFMIWLLIAAPLGTLPRKKQSSD